MKKLIFIFSFIALTSLTTYAQQVCISQEAAQKAVENAKLIPVLEEKIQIQDQALAEKDKSIKEIQDVARKNQDDLEARLKATEIELARLSGQLTAKEAEATRNLALIDVLLKSTKKKCLPFSVCF